MILYSKGIFWRCINKYSRNEIVTSKRVLTRTIKSCTVQSLDSKDNKKMRKKCIPESTGVPHPESSNFFSIICYVVVIIIKVFLCTYIPGILQSTT